MKRVSRFFMALTILGVSVSGVTCSLDREMLEKVSSIEALPKNVDVALEGYFHSFKLGLKTKFVGRVDPIAVGMKARLSGYEYLEIDISDSESFSKCMGKLEDKFNKNKMVVTLKNIDCRNVGRFRDVYKKFTRCDDFMLYVYDPLLNCGDKQCKNCIDLVYESGNFSDFERLNCYGGVATPDARGILADLVCKWKEMVSRGELDVDINLDDEDIDIISTCLLGKNLSNLRDGIRRAFVVSSMRKDGSKSMVCLEDFMKAHMDHAMYSAQGYKMDSDYGVQVAVHEMGHAVVGHLLGCPVRVVVTREHMDGVTFMLGKDKYWFAPYETFEDLVIGAKFGLAGKLADKLINGYDSDGATSDIIQVKKMLEKAILIREPMLDPMNYSLLQSEANELYENIRVDVEKIIMENSEVIRRMAKRLIDRKPVNGLKTMKESEFLKSFEEVENEIQKENECRAKLIEMMKNKKLTCDVVSKIEECLKNFADDDTYVFANDSESKEKQENGIDIEKIRLEDVKKKSKLAPIFT